MPLSVSRFEVEPGHQLLYIEELEDRKRGMIEAEVKPAIEVTIMKNVSFQEKDTGHRWSAKEKLGISTVFLLLRDEKRIVKFFSRLRGE